MAQNRPKKSLFKPVQRDKHELVRLVPPLVHMSAYVTGGLKRLFHNISHQTVPKLHEQGHFTDKRGCFRYKSSLPLLAFRYKFVEIIGKGQSCIFIKATDTFKDDALVSIKILHTSYGVLGIQECDCIRRMNMADPWEFSSTLRLLNTFIFDDHFCMVFDLFYPSPLTHYFKNMDKSVKIKYIRKATLKLLQVLGFLKSIDVIHADLKPENILLADENDTSTLRVVDFGNAIHCVHDEVSLYYEDFELQTLLYRAPEVMFGIPFSTEIDMWSLGCILAELYTGKPLFYGKDKRELLSAAVSMLGTFPKNLFHRGKFYSTFKELTKDGIQPSATPVMIKRLQLTGDYAFADFLAKLLRFNPDERLTPTQAARHPFLAPELGLLYMCSDNETYSPIMLDNSYSFKPLVAPEIQKKHLAPRALLSEGTTGHIIVPTVQQVTQVQPVKQNSKANKKIVPKTTKTLNRNCFNGKGSADLSDIMEQIRVEEEKIYQANSVYSRNSDQHMYNNGSSFASYGCHQKDDSLSRVRFRNNVEVDTNCNQLDRHFQKQPVTVIKNTYSTLERHSSVLDLSNQKSVGGESKISDSNASLQNKGNFYDSCMDSYDNVDGYIASNKQLCYASEAPRHEITSEYPSSFGHTYENGALNLCAKKQSNQGNCMDSYPSVHDMVENGQPLDFTTSCGSQNTQSNKQLNKQINLSRMDVTRKSQSRVGLEKIPNDIVSQKLKNICRSVIEEQRINNSQILNGQEKTVESQALDKKKNFTTSPNTNTGKRSLALDSSPVAKKKPRKSKPSKTTVFEEDPMLDDHDSLDGMENESKSHERENNLEKKKPRKSKPSKTTVFEEDPMLDDHDSIDGMENESKSHERENNLEKKKYKECVSEKKAKKPPSNIKAFKNVTEPLMASTPKISRKKTSVLKSKFDNEIDHKKADSTDQKTSLLDENFHDTSLEQTSRNSGNNDCDDDGELVQYLNKLTGDHKKVNSRTKTIPISAEKLRNLMDIFMKMRNEQPEKERSSAGTVHRVSLVNNSKISNRSNELKKSDENCNEIVDNDTAYETGSKSSADTVRDCSINLDKIDQQNAHSKRVSSKFSSDIVNKLKSKFNSVSSPRMECTAKQNSNRFDSDESQSDDDKSPDYQLPSMGLYESESDEECKKSVSSTRKSSVKMKSKAEKPRKTGANGSISKSLSKDVSQSKNVPDDAVFESKSSSGNFDIDMYVKSQMWPQSSFLQTPRRSKCNSSEKHSIPKNFLKQKLDQNTEKPVVRSNKPTLRGYKRKQAEAKKTMQKTETELEYASNQSTEEDSPVSVRRPRRRATPVKIMDFSSDEERKKLHEEYDDDSTWEDDIHLVEYN